MESKNAKLAPQEIPTVARIKFIIWGLVLLGGLAPFFHVPFLWENDIKGDFFGFRYLSSFLYAIGYPITFICTGFLLRFIADHLPVEFTKTFYLFGHIFSAVGFYFLIWAFASGLEEYPDGVILPAIGILAVSLCFASHYLVNSYNNYISLLRRMIRDLVDVLVLKVPKHVKDPQAYQDTIVKPTINKLYDQTK